MVFIWYRSFFFHFCIIFFRPVLYRVRSTWTRSPPYPSTTRRLWHTTTSTTPGNYFLMTCAYSYHTCLKLELEHRTCTAVALAVVQRELEAVSKAVYNGICSKNKLIICKTFSAVNPGHTYCRRVKIMKKSNISRHCLFQVTHNKPNAIFLESIQWRYKFSQRWHLFPKDGIFFPGWWMENLWIFPPFRLLFRVLGSILNIHRYCRRGGEGGRGGESMFPRNEKLSSSSGGGRPSR